MKRAAMRFLGFRLVESPTHVRMVLPRYWVRFFPGSVDAAVERTRRDLAAKGGKATVRKVSERALLIELD